MDNSHDESPVLTIYETMALLKVCRAHIYRLIAKGKLRRVHWPAVPGRTYFSTSDVKKLMEPTYIDVHPTVVQEPPPPGPDPIEEPEPDVLLIM